MTNTLWFKDYLEDFEELNCDQCGSWNEERLEVIEDRGELYVNYVDRSCYSAFDVYEPIQHFFKLSYVPDNVKQDVDDWLKSQT